MSIFYAYEPRFTGNVCLSCWWEKPCEACWKLGGRGLKDLDRDGGYMLFNGPRWSLTLVGEARSVTWIRVCVARLLRHKPGVTPVRAFRDIRQDMGM